MSEPSAYRRQTWRKIQVQRVEYSYPLVSSVNSCPHTFPFAGMQGSHSRKGMAILSSYVGYKELHVPGCKTHARHNTSFSSSFSYLAVKLVIDGTVHPTSTVNQRSFRLLVQAPPDQDYTSSCQQQIPN